MHALESEEPVLLDPLKEGKATVLSSQMPRTELIPQKAEVVASTTQRQTGAQVLIGSTVAALSCLWTLTYDVIAFSLNLLVSPDQEDSALISPLWCFREFMPPDLALTDEV